MSREDFAEQFAIDTRAQFGPDWKTTVAMLLNVDPNTVQRWSKGEVSPREKRWPDIDSLLQWTPGTTDELLARRAPQRPPGTLEWLVDALERNTIALERNTTAVERFAESG